MKKVAAAEPLGLMLEQDQSKQARTVWQVEQRAQASKDIVGSREAVGQMPKVSWAQKKILTSTNHVTSIRTALEQLLDDTSIDYIGLTKRCRRLLADSRKFWYIELVSQGINGLP